MHVNSNYPLYCAEALSRVYYYPAPYVTPMLKYDGRNGGSSYGGWRSMIENRMQTAEQAPVTITMWGDYTASDGSGTVYVQFRNDSTATISGRVLMVITEDSLYYLGNNGDPWHNHVARDYLPTHNGQTVTIAPGDSVVVSQPFTIQGNWDEQMCDIVAWIQDDILSNGVKNVWQGAQIPVTQLGIVEDESREIAVPNVMALPNPCVDGTEFSFDIPVGSEYRIDIFNVTGQHIKTLQGITSGTHNSVRWNRANEDGMQVSSGVYFYRFESNATQISGKIVVR